MQTGKIYKGDTLISGGGANGKSAYEIWLAAGHTGTEADFLASLQGNPGSSQDYPFELENSLNGGTNKALTAEQGKVIGAVLFGSEKEYVELTWNPGAIYFSTRYAQYIQDPIEEGDVISVKLNDYNTYRFSIVVVTSSTFGDGTIISDTGWKTADYVKTIEAGENNYYCRLVISKVSNTNITLEEATGSITEVKATRTMGYASDSLIANVNSIIEWIGDKVVDLSLYEEELCSLGSSYWYNEGTQKHIAIPVEPNEKLSLKLNSAGSSQTGYYTFVTDAYAPPYSNNAAIPFATGLSSRSVLTVGGQEELIAPSDAAYLILTIVDGANNGCKWSLYRPYNADNKTLFSRLDLIESRVEDIDEEVFGQPSQEKEVYTEDTVEDKYITYNNTPRGGIFIDIENAEYVGSLQIAQDAPIKGCIHLTETVSWATDLHYDSGWITPGNSGQVSNANDSAGSAKYLALSFTYVSTNSGAPTIEEIKQYVTYEVEVNRNVKNGLRDEIESIKAIIAAENITASVPFDLRGDTTYVGKMISFATHHFSSTIIGSLSSGVSSRQGSAVFGNYFFQFHNTLASIVVFDLSTGTNVQTINLTANENNHAGSGGFSKKYYNSGDPFPLLYISSMDEKKIYVYRIQGSVGNWSAALIQTITLAIDFFLPNIAIDAANDRIIVFGYTVNSWSSPDGNNSVVCFCPIPDIGQDETITVFEGKMIFNYLYAQQGAVASYGKLYLSFGNTGYPSNGGGGLVVIDYIQKNIDSFVDFAVIGNFEPEGIGIWNESIVLSDQAGVVRKLTFN